jgi:predicted MFS family arabinose efflux permease
VGRLLDLRGERVVVTAGGVWLALGAFVAALTPGFGWLLLALFIGGIGYASSQPGGSKAVAGWFGEERRGLALGIRQTGLPLGGALAAGTLPYIALDWGWRPALLVAAAVCAAGSISFAFIYRDPAGEFEPRTYEFGPELRRLLGYPPLRPALLAGLVMVGTQFTLLSYLIPFLRDDLRVAAATAALALAAVQTSGVAGRVLLAAWSDRLGPPRRMIAVGVGALVAMSGVLLLAVAPRRPGAGLLLAVAVVLGFFAFGWYGPWVVHVTELAPKSSVGLTLTFAMTANQLGIVAAPPIFGLVVDATSSFSIAWLALGAALCLTSAITLVSSTTRR